MLVQASAMAESFWDIKAANVVTIAAFVIAYLRFRIDRRKDDQERMDARIEMENRQERRHMENQYRFESLIQFHKEQLEINRKRDEQLGELKTQTAIMMQMARGFDKRLGKLEGYE